MVEATAPGKVILFGEHAVVYGRPAIAAPVTHLRARAVVQASDKAGMLLVAPDLGMRVTLAAAAADNPLAVAARLVQAREGVTSLDGLSLTVSSAIPIAGGLGSGAAISVAVIRALAACLGAGERFPPSVVSELAYEVERLHHGTPSGIDNTVIALEQPVYFVRRPDGNLIEPFVPGRSLHLLIGDTGVRSSTRDVVGDVRRQWELSPRTFEVIFDACGRLAEAGREAIVAGDVAEIGRLMSANHDRLREMTVSSPELDNLVEAACRAGALGAKLSGAGRGGNMIALVTSHSAAEVRAALLRAGARHVYESSVG